MFHAVARTTAVSTTYAAKKKYSLTGLRAAAPAAMRNTAAPIQNFIGRSSSKQPLGPDPQNDQQQPERHRRRPRGAEEHEHDGLGDAEDQAGNQRAGHAAEPRQHHPAEGASDVDAVHRRLDRADHDQLRYGYDAH